MNTQTKTIGERMQARQIEAREKIRALLWGDSPDGDAIAETALRAGLSAAEVAGLEADVAGVKALLSAAEGVDVAELARASAAAVATEAKADAAAQRAVDAAAQARDRAIEAEQALSVAKLAVAKAAQAAANGSIPAGKVTGAVRAALAEQKAEQLATERHGKAGILRHGVIPKLRAAADAAEKLAENYKHTPTPTPSLEAEKAGAIQSAKAARARLATAEAELAALSK